MYPWKNQSDTCSVSCGTGQLKFERDVAHESNCSVTKLESECTKEPCTTSTTTTTTTTSTATSTIKFLESTESTSKSDTLVIIAIFLAVVCLVIFIAAFVLFLCSRRPQYRVEYYGSRTQRSIHSRPPSPYPPQVRSNSSKETGTPAFGVKNATISANL